MAFDLNIVSSKNIAKKAIEAVEQLDKALEKSMDNAHGGLFHTLQGYVKTAAFTHSRRNGQR